MSEFEKTGKQWLAARDIIANSISEIRGKDEMSEADKKNAAAIIARLADHDLLICNKDEIKE